MNFFVFQFLLYLALAQNATLGSYNVDLGSTTISGLSGGAIFSMQMQVAMSRHIKGAGMFSLFPYGCAQNNGTLADLCLRDPSVIDLNTLENLANNLASAGRIDAIENIKNSKIYVQNGASDPDILQDVAIKAAELYQRFGADLKTEFELDTGHGLPTVDFGQNCRTGLGILKCDYDGAKIVLTHLLGDLKNSTDMVPENTQLFNQLEFFDSNMGMGATGVIYVPTACQNGARCKLHIHFHGCGAMYDFLGLYYVNYIGFNEVAEANNIIILYPQASLSTENPINPEGCFDIYGYLNDNMQYLTKDGVQISRIWNMARRISSDNVFTEFFKGFAQGIQVNSTDPSYCVQQLDKVDVALANILDTFVQAIQNLDLNGPYWTIFAFNNALNLLAEVAEECGFRILTENIVNLASSEGIANLLTRIALQFRNFNDLWQGLFADLAAGVYLSAGKNFGKLLSIILNFEI